MITHEGEEYTILLKSMSEFSVLLEFDGENIVVGIDESKEIDLNDDFVTDVELSLTKIEDSKAFMTFAKLKKSAAAAGAEGITGFITANPAGAVIIVVIVVALGSVAFKFRRRGSK